MGRDTVDKIFADSEGSTETIPDDFLLHIADMDRRTVIAGLLKTKSTSRLSSVHTYSGTSDTDIITAWKSKCEGTYKCLQERLDSFSIFAGRNILVS